MLDFLQQKKGLLHDTPTGQITKSGGAMCNESFAFTIVKTWSPFYDALAHRPMASFIPDPTTVVENTGDLFSQLEGGDAVETLMNIKI
jgi:hypothetical protein